VSAIYYGRNLRSLTSLPTFNDIMWASTNCSFLALSIDCRRQLQFFLTTRYYETWTIKQVFSPITSSRTVLTYLISSQKMGKHGFSTTRRPTYQDICIRWARGSLIKALLFLSTH
jgi:hypothetical protein